MPIQDLLRDLGCSAHAVDGLEQRSSPCSREDVFPLRQNSRKSLVDKVHGDYQPGLNPIAAGWYLGLIKTSATGEGAPRALHLTPEQFAQKEGAGRPAGLRQHREPLKDQQADAPVVPWKAAR